MIDGKLGSWEEILSSFFLPTYERQVFTLPIENQNGKTFTIQYAIQLTSFFANLPYLI